MKECVFANGCRHSNYENCNKLCYAYAFMHGLDGNNGLWKTRHVPKQYEDCRIDNLPLINPPRVYDGVIKYANNILEYVDKGIGLFLFAMPTESNKLGTGTGKTTSACTLINEFMIARTKEHLKGGKSITNNPTYFIRISEFQNVYNAQFRGSKDVQIEASERYYNLKKILISAELVVFDDIALRTATETFINELYEVIDTRVTEIKASIFTSNMPLNKLSEIYGDRIVSRIEGTCVLLPFIDEDHRKGGLSL